jgi:hypothetical protein
MGFPLAFYYDKRIVLLVVAMCYVQHLCYDVFIRTGKQYRK